MSFRISTFFSLKSFRIYLLLISLFLLSYIYNLFNNAISRSCYISFLFCLLLHTAMRMRKYVFHRVSCGSWRRVKCRMNLDTCQLSSEKENWLSRRKLLPQVCRHNLLYIVVYRITPYVRHSLLSVLKICSFNNEDKTTQMVSWERHTVLGTIMRKTRQRGKVFTLNTVRRRWRSPDGARAVLTAEGKRINSLLCETLQESPH
jgi:hypothetical protein